MRTQKARQPFLLLMLGLCWSNFTIGFAQSEKPAPNYQQAVSYQVKTPNDVLVKARIRFHRTQEAKLSDGSTLSIVGHGIIRRGSSGQQSVFPSDRILPVNSFRVIAEEAPGHLWIATTQGLIYCDTTQPTTQVRYFFGKRWLIDNDISAIGFERADNARRIYAETAKGLCVIEFKPMTLAEKSRYFWERIRQRHVRWGLTADSQLRVPGDLTSNQMVSTDNDGLWTAMYVAAECFRYKVTGQDGARRFAQEGMQALLRLEEITGIPGFPARSFIKKGVDLQPRDGEWHDTPDGIWRWKGDTSSDEIVGHYFVYPIYFDLVADETEKRRLAGALDRITNHILDNNYQLIDVDGKATRWCWWGPDVIWEDPDETGLRALHLLAHLRTAMHVTQSAAHRAKYQRHYDELINKHRYHLLMRNQKINVPGHVNHSDDELAFLSYYPLLQYETDPKLREVYVQSLERAWLVERPERNPLWNFIYAAGSGSKEFDREESIRTLREIPMDQIEWTVTNSHRLDVPINSYVDRQGRKQALIVLPYDELPMSKWNGNPYRLDGGNEGRSEDDGAYFLLPYWLGRYHKLIEE
jgi:hypothetical protein